MSSLKPLGIFWDINACDIPLTISDHILDCVQRLRDFISIELNDKCLEYEFNCVHNSYQLNDSIIESLEANGCQMFSMDSLKIHQLIERFVDNYGFDSVLVIISDNECLSRAIRSAKRKEVTIILIYNHNSSEEFLTNADHSFAFNDVFGLKRVLFSVTNLPKNKSRRVIRDSFMSFCRRFRCKFRFNGRQTIKLDFSNEIDSKTAQNYLSEHEFFGNVLVVEIDDNHIHREDNVSPKSMLVSVPSPQKSNCPENDDKCKSVIIGLYSHCKQSVIKLVRDLVKSWNESTLNESSILRVNRERDFIGRDGKATLIVTAIDKQTNDRLISVAKNRFVDKNKKLYWNRLQRSKKGLNVSEKSSINDNTEVDSSCKSVVTGLWTRHDDNVLKLIEDLVQNWHSFDVKHIIRVERSKKFMGKDGKAALIVSTDTPVNNEKLIDLASNEFINNKKRLYWKPIQSKKIKSSQELSNNFMNKTTEKRELNQTFASIALKSTYKQNNMKSNDLNPFELNFSVLSQKHNNWSENILSPFSPFPLFSEISTQLYQTLS